MSKYSLTIVHPSSDLHFLEGICKDLGVKTHVQWLRQVPVVCIVMNRIGEVHWHSTHFLAEIVLKSKSLTGDTVRSYGYSIISWLNYLELQELEMTDVTEQDLQLFRNEIWGRASAHGSNFRAAKSTVVARVETARRFHEWGVRTNRFESPLGQWAHAHAGSMKLTGHGSFRRCSRPLSALRPEQRLPKILSAADLKKLITIAPEPYSLLFKWAVTTGLRRMELCHLTKEELDTVSFAGNNRSMMTLDVLRKGGRLVSTYLPAPLMNDTRWYIHTTRPQARRGAEHRVFLTKNGHSLQREEVSRVFRDCADEVGSKATLHHLRHTFAVTVLQILQQQAQAGAEINPLKTLQVLMGHSTLASTEIYLRALDVYSDEVAEALDFLYGASI
ncbi:tyrosine-type recombinase/integrase [Massilia terrae]|uniref:Tyrosine-type recombinase/integrase n=1 Tax=Massilia terrae TaxID=1811224 RepID=A0ABT2D3E9_9BURK|nr:tyrosine-type recombinase/integrase [Massilia terrae]MCS0660764.1 tyrosine-type recombinase/integrase [Massilia terrae]